MFDFFLLQDPQSASTEGAAYAAALIAPTALIRSRRLTGMDAIEFIALFMACSFFFFIISPQD
jgi:hypothetical protein